MYSDTVMDHFRNPRNVGKPEGRAVKGEAGNPNAGVFMVLFLVLEGELIQEAGFQTYGCCPAIAAGSLLTEMVKGSLKQEVWKITPDMLRSRMGDLPLGKRSCADLAIEALHNALNVKENP